MLFNLNVEMNITSTLEMEFVDKPKVTFGYQNWRGENAERSAQLLRMYYGKNDYHPQTQWIVVGLDLDKDQERHYSLKDMENVIPYVEETEEEAIEENGETTETTEVTE